MAKPLSTLAINVTRIGDTLLTTPALRAIAAGSADGQLHFLGHPKRSEIIEHLPYVASVGGITKTVAPFLGHLDRLAGKRFERAYVFGYDEALVAYALRVAREVVAFRQGDAALNRRLAICVDAPDPASTHAVDCLLALPQALGLPDQGRQLDYTVTPAEAEWAARELAGAVPSTCIGLIGLQVASFPTRAYRDWPLEHFVALTDRLRQHYPSAHFLIFGGSEEKTRTEALAAHLGSAASLFAGKLSLRQTAALMNRLDLYIGVDTGPTHIMGALHRPLVAMYHGFTPSWRLRPLDHPCAYIIDHPLAGKGATPETPMADISVDCVWQVVQRALAEHPPAGHTA